MPDNYTKIPKYWVFVVFEDGYRINIAIADTISANFARDASAYWNKHNNGHGFVIKVTLEDSNQRVLMEW